MEELKSNPLVWVITCAFLVFSYTSKGQTSRFEDEILAFKAQDQELGYQTDFILFTGSSSIRLWHSLEQDMEGLKVLNRGFGGATLRELNMHWKVIAGEHNPDLVVLYCGENDLSEGATATETLHHFVSFLSHYRDTYPKVPLAYIAMKPSLSRWHLWEKFQEVDSLIKHRLQNDPNVTFVDLSPTMLDDDGLLKPEIFEPDSLHMNALGYKGWTSILRPLIEKSVTGRTKTPNE